MLIIHNLAVINVLKLNLNETRPAKMLILPTMLDISMSFMKLCAFTHIHRASYKQLNNCLLTVLFIKRQTNKLLEYFASSGTNVTLT